MSMTHNKNRRHFIKREVPPIFIVSHLPEAGVFCPED